MYRILLIEDDEGARRSSEEILRSANHDVVAVGAADAIWLLEKESFDVVIAGEVAASSQLEAKPLPVLVHLPRPLRPEDVANAIDGVQQRDWIQRQLSEASASLEESASEPVVGASRAIQRVLDIVAAVAESEAPVLLTGESGTGKDLLAHTIHARSARKNKPLVVVNCAAFPETLLEAELFGYERGAFTGALQKRDGRFRAAHGGTLFLDEVNSLSLAAQAKLLRVLHDGTFQPIGTNTTLSVDVRLISATNRDLKALVAAGAFREDLYYRIKVLDIHAPPLRERRGDVPLLVQHFLKKYGARGGVSPRAWAALADHDFPGNVRELEHTIHRALVLSRGEEIELEHLPEDVIGATIPSSGVPPSHQRTKVDDVRPLAEVLGEFEHEYLLSALRAARGNKTKAAERLRISRKSLWQRLQRLGALGTKLEGNELGEIDRKERDRAVTADPPRRGRRRAP